MTYAEMAKEIELTDKFEIVYVNQEEKIEDAKKKRFKREYIKLNGEYVSFGVYLGKYSENKNMHWFWDQIDVVHRFKSPKDLISSFEETNLMIIHFLPYISVEM